MSSVSATPPLLLDTHYWVWLQQGTPGTIRPAVLRAIQDAANRGALLLSAISVWEVCMLESKGRLQFRMPCDQWVAMALQTPGLSMVPLTPEIAFDSTHLPGDFHGDPADRIVVASARVMSARVATLDRGITAYCRRHAGVESI